MMASVVLYSLIRWRRSRSCFRSSLRRSRPTVAGDAGSSPTWAPLSSGPRTLAKARACANVTGPPAALAFGMRADFAERRDLARVGFLRRELFLAIAWSFQIDQGLDTIDGAFSKCDRLRSKAAPPS